MSNCERDSEGRVIDPITLDPIPEDRIISFEQLGTTFCFDIESLSNYVTTQGKLVNPLNRQPLPSEVIDSLQVYRVENNVLVRFKSAVSRESSIHDTTVSNNITIGDLLILMSEKTTYPVGYIDSLIVYRSGNTLNTFNLDTYPMETKLKDVIGNASEINMGLKGLTDSVIKNRYQKLYIYAHSIGNHRVMNSVPERYRVYIPGEPDSLMMEIISEFILDNKNKPDIYLITGLSKLLKDSRISAKFATAVHRALASRVIKAEASWLPVLHYMYSRVIDPHLLNRNIPVQGQYVLPEGEKPTFESKYERIRRDVEASRSSM